MRRVAGVASLLAVLTCPGPKVAARDVFVMLSGGVSPFDNNYSQFLQARALTDYFETRYPHDSVWTFFGAGNVTGGSPVMADVRQKRQTDGLTIDTWLPGQLPRNRPASREIVLRALRDEILPAVASGGTLYLFVGDHGSQSSSKEGESQIDLWELSRDAGSEHGWRSERNASLGVAELRRTLAAGIGKGRVVFCMTQCHSGGFHHLAIPRWPSPNPKWFRVLPAWGSSATASTFPIVAGFTATDELSPAAGCDPNPTSLRWAGYERFVPEQLLGSDLLTRQSTGKGLRSIAEAHLAATLQDQTIDKPYSTSEAYLERWAVLIETRLLKETNLTAKATRALATYQRTLDGVAPKVSDPAFRERQTQFRSFIESMSEQNPEAGFVSLVGSRLELEEVIGSRRESDAGRPPEDRGPETPRPRKRPGGRGGFGESRRLWRETIRPAWSLAVEASTVTNLTPVVQGFERHLLRLERTEDISFWGGGEALEKEVFWYSGYGNPQTMDQARAEAVARWSVERRSKILAWASSSREESVSDAARSILQRPSRRQAGGNLDDPALGLPERLGRKTAAERTLFYRRVLGAWEFLLAVNERPALTRVRELTELERTPFPQPK